MQGKKGNAEINRLVEKAKAKGFDLLPMMEFFTGWYEPHEA